jgi:hypothetical protein
MNKIKIEIDIINDDLVVSKNYILNFILKIKQYYINILL